MWIHIKSILLAKIINFSSTFWEPQQQIKHFAVLTKSKQASDWMGHVFSSQFRIPPGAAILHLDKIFQSCSLQAPKTGNILCYRTPSSDSYFVLFIQLHDEFCLCLPHSVVLCSRSARPFAIERVLDSHVQVSWVLLILWDTHGTCEGLTLTYCDHILQIHHCLLPVSRSWSWSCKNTKVKLENTQKVPELNHLLLPSFTTFGRYVRHITCGKPSGLMTLRKCDIKIGHQCMNEIISRGH